MPVKAESVQRDGTPDGFVPDVGFISQTEPGMPTRLLISVLPDDLARVHQALVGACAGPLSVRWVQKVDRANPRPENAPPREFLALGVDADLLMSLLFECAGLLYDDGRGELWVRGRRGEQVILDGDGLLYTYPDDVLFRGVCAALGLAEGPVKTLLDRDFVKQWYRAPYDAQEKALVQRLSLQEMTPR